MWSAAWSPVCLYVLHCLVTVCAWPPACTSYGCFYFHLTRLPCHSVHLRMAASVSPHLCPVILLSVCYYLYILPSFFLVSPSFLPPPLFLSRRLFIRCVNNCLPTVVIAPPCQPEVWSKWQCAQFSLAYIIQFLVSLVPLAKKSPLLMQMCFIRGINFWTH